MEKPKLPIPSFFPELPPLPSSAGDLPQLIGKSMGNINFIAEKVKNAQEIGYNLFKMGYHLQSIPIRLMGLFFGGKEKV